MKKQMLFILALLSLAVYPSIGFAARVTPDWLVEESAPNDAPLQDPMLLYNAGGVDGSVAIIGQPSMRTYRHILVGVDLHRARYFLVLTQGTRMAHLMASTSM